MKKDITDREAKLIEDVINHLGVQSNFCTVRIDKFTTLEGHEDLHDLVEVITGLSIDLPGDVFLNIGIECLFYPEGRRTDLYVCVDISDNPLNDDTTLELFTTDDGKECGGNDAIHFYRWLSYHEMVNEARNVIGVYFQKFMCKISTDLVNMTFNVMPNRINMVLKI